MNYQAIVDKYYPEIMKLCNCISSHIANLYAEALQIVSYHPGYARCPVHVEEAAMLHDLGIFMTDAHLSIQCFGSQSYICHGHFRSRNPAGRI